MKKVFGLFLSAALLFTLGFPAPSFSQAMQTTEQSVSFEEVESFIQQAYQMRTNAVTNPGTLSLLSQLYASSSSKLQEYEQRRAEFWRNWGNLYGQVLSFTSTVSLIPGTLKQIDLTLSVQAREILTITWKPNLRTGMEYWEEKLANATNDSERKQAEQRIENLKNFPKIVDSQVGVTHFLELVRTDQNFQIVKDGYTEVFEFPSSPDYQFSLTDSRLTQFYTGFKLEMSVLRTQHHVPEWYTLCTYYRNSAVNYARQYALNYNPYYKRFDPPYGNGDCANFVSQSIYAGNQAMVWPGMYGTQWWYDHHGTYDTSDDTYSFNWINTYMLDFLTNQTRASVTDGNQMSAGNLLAGDLVDWWNHSHVVIVDTPGSSPLIDSHSDNLLRYPLPAGNYHLYHLYDQYYVGGP